MLAVVPEPPLMVPQLCTGREVETAPMRSSALAVVGRLADETNRWVVLGADPAGRRSVAHPPVGTFLGYGVDVRVALQPGPLREATAGLPLPLLIAGWLRGVAAPEVFASAELVPPDLEVADCRALGAELAGRYPGRVGLLVVGDGARYHTDQVAGRVDERSTTFDDAVATALDRADPDGLLALDPALGTELGAAGRAPWQVMAGVALAEGGTWRGELTYSGAPYGVAYHVAVWQR